MLAGNEVELITYQASNTCGHGGELSASRLLFVRTVMAFKDIRYGLCQRCNLKA